MDKVLAIHEASGQDVTFQDGIAFALVSGGGKPGQGYPCILVMRSINEQSEHCKRSITKDLTGNM